MDILEILEGRIDALLAEIKFLRKENAKFRQEKSSGITSVAQENERLKRALKEEQQSNIVTQKRIERLLSSISEVISDKQ